MPPGLVKRYGEVTALGRPRPRGRRKAPIMGLLGPNGAGKTTAVSILDHTPRA